MEHPYMRPSPFMHIPGIPGGPIPANVHLLKDGRLAHGGMDDPRLSNIHDLGECMSILSVSLLLNG